MQKLQELLTTGSAPEQILTDIYRTIVENVKTSLVATNFVGLRFGPDSIPGSSLNIIGQEKNSLSVSLVGEGAEVPIATEGTFSWNMKPKKYGIRPLITKEMQEDSLFDVVNRNLAEASYQLARRIDRIILTAVRQGAGNTVTGGSTITIANITSAMQNLEANDYVPTDMIIGPAVANDLRNIDTFVEADKAGVSDPTKSLIGTIFGMKVWQSNNIFSTDVATSANTTDCLVIDRRHAVAFAEKRPITIERYNDVTRQLDGIVITTRFDAKAIPTADGGTTTSAICLITTT